MRMGQLNRERLKNQRLRDINNVCKISLTGNLSKARVIVHWYKEVWEKKKKPDISYLTYLLVFKYH